MKKFNEPEMDVVKLNVTDIIATSPDGPPDGENDLGWG